ncbi:uncharacterized protein METZ01_LOCUS25291 [marine metagenome]|uniref:Uncharacterized protein n=1 Tax=marine metagenome TaxID=408172 RepID=A0A381Q2U7_9ZZZZ
MPGRSSGGEEREGPNVDPRFLEQKVGR